MFNCKLDSIHYFIPKLKPKSVEKTNSVLSKIQEFKAKLKSLKSISSEKKFFFSQSTKKPVNCTDLGYPYLPAVKSSSSLSKLQNSHLTQSQKPEKQVDSDFITITSSTLQLNNEKNLYSDTYNQQLSRNSIHYTTRSMIQLNKTKKELGLNIINNQAKKKSENFVYKTQQKVKKNRILEKRKSDKVSIGNLFTKRYSENKNERKNFNVALSAREKSSFKGSRIIVNDVDNESQERKVERLDKLIECNDSIVSSLSSTIIERAPRYQINLEPEFKIYN